MPNIDPKLWGPSLWASMIYVAKGYPEAEPHYQIKQSYEKFYRNLAEVIPCETCQANFTKHLAQYPPDLTNQTTLLNWLYTIHNKTLIDQNRKPMLSTESFIKKFTKSSYSSSPLNSQNPMILIIALLALAMVAYYIYGGVVG